MDQGSRAGGGAIVQVAVNPVTPTLLNALASSDGLFRSLDGGESWLPAAPHFFAVSRITVGADGHTTYAATPWHPVSQWRSDNNGASWQPIPIPGEHGSRKVYAHPTQPDTALAVVDGSNGIHKSENRGEDWVLVTEGITDAPVTALGIDPLNPLAMALGTANGNVFLPGDGGASWSLASQAPVGATGAE